MFMRRIASRLFSTSPQWSRNDHVAPKTFAGLTPYFSSPQLEHPLPCPGCDDRIEFPAQSWVCPGCGEYSCESCFTRDMKKKCSSCGCHVAALSLPNSMKTHRGAALLKTEIDSLMLIRAAVHSVAMEAQDSFLEGNKDLSQGAEHYTYGIKCLNWIASQTPEFFHSGGFDADLLRLQAMRAASTGDVETSQRITDEHPHLFVSQHLLPVEKPRNPARFDVRHKCDPATLFLNEESLGEVWKRQGKISWSRKSEDALFQKHSGVLYASDKWETEQMGLLADHRWVFPSEWDAASFLAFRYNLLSDKLPLNRNSLVIGTDCVVYAGGGFLPDQSGHVVVNQLFREGPMVAKLVLSQRLGKVTHAQLLQTFNEMRINSWSVASHVQRILEEHPFQGAPTNSWLGGLRGIFD